MILVTGATGTTGNEVVRLLAAKREPVRALVRDPDKARAIKAPGVEFVKGDFADPSLLDAALRGADKAFLLSSPDARSVELQGNFIQAARRVGTKQVVKLSAIAAAVDSGCRLLRWHGEIEKLLEESGIAYTHLRPSFFMQNMLMVADVIAKEGVFHLPTGDGKMGMVDARDIAAVAVKTLTEAGHEGKAYVITGSEALSHQQAAAKISNAIGKPVKFVDISPTDFRNAMLKLGMPEWFADGLNELYSLVREGHAAVVTNVVAEVAKKKPITFDQFARDYTGAFKKGA